MSLNEIKDKHIAEDDEPQVKCLCCQCGGEIYEGDAIYDINDKKWCEECVHDCRSTAESEE